MTRTVDVHNHLYAEMWMDFLEKRTDSPRMARTADGVRSFYFGNTIFATIRFKGHYDPAARIEDLDRYGLDCQMLSHTIPSIDFLPPKEAADWAKRLNDYFAEVCRAYPGRFYAYATLSYQDIDEAQRELERAYKELGVKGVLIFSNINGRPLASPEFHPIYAMAAEYGLPLFVHPTVPLVNEVLKQDKHFGGIAAGVFGYTLDTSLAVLGLIWYGVLEKYPGLNIIHSHTGGVVPYLSGRMEELWRLQLPSEKTSGVELPRTPSEYYRDQVYPDSVSTFLPAVKCCLEYVGAKRMLLGTDYAHRMGIWEQAVRLIKELGLSEADTNSILGDNAARLFKLDAEGHK